MSSTVVHLPCRVTSRHVPRFGCARRSPGGRRGPRPTVVSTAVIEALVFDFDGVVIDTETPEYGAWVEVYRRHGCHLELAEWAPGIGSRERFDPYSTLVARAARPVDGEAEVRRAKRLLAGPQIALTQPLPGVLDWLEECRSAGIPVGIASSSTPSIIAEHLDRIGLTAFFRCIACCDGTLRPKPAPDTYVTACERLGADPSRTMAVEDSSNGVAAAAAAGLKCVAVPHGLTRDLDFASADLVLESLSSTTVREVAARLFPPS
jgi:HAD superfamily hydrolase (TIGR01509 family)